MRVVYEHVRVRLRARVPHTKIDHAAERFVAAPPLGDALFVLGSALAGLGWSAAADAELLELLLAEPLRRGDVVVDAPGEVRLVGEGLLRPQLDHSLDHVGPEAQAVGSRAQLVVAAGVDVDPLHDREAEGARSSG